VTIKRHWGQSQFDQTIVLYAGKNRVDIENHFDWRETHVLLKVAFPAPCFKRKGGFRNSLRGHRSSHNPGKLD
jgi:alpha-mannosidase